MRIDKVLVVVGMSLFMLSRAFAGEIDVLVGKLVEKGILNEQDAKEVLAETKAEIKKQLDEGKLDTLPKWVQTTKFSGDLRFRFRNQDRAVVSDRNRLSLRLRYGFETKVNDKLKVGARLATGSNSSQVTREQPTSDSFSLRNIWLDLAYLDYSINKNARITAGKIKNPFYSTHDLIWDSNVTPEGAVAEYKTSFGHTDTKTDVSANLAILPLDFDNNTSPVIYASQVVMSREVFARKLKTGITYYDADSIKNGVYANITPNNSKLTNTTSGGRFVYDYNIVDISVEYPVYNVKISDVPLPVNLLGGYVKNFASGVKKDTGWLLGFQLGKALQKNNWDFSYNYRRLAADAVLDFLNDNTFHDGGTNCKGHKVSLRYIPLENTEACLTNYYAKKISGIKTSGEVLDIIQLEFTAKF